MFSYYGQNVIVGIVIPFIIAYISAMILGPVVIRLLKKEHAAQTEREEGLDSHKKKTGTPTMGGFIFLIPFLVITFIWMFRWGSEFGDFEQNVAILIMAAGFGFIGFLDDYIKVVMHRNLGLRVWQKLALQFVVTAAFAFYAEQTGVGLDMRIPFMRMLQGADASLVMTDFGVLKYPVLFFITLATVNGTNFTDGVDGLCGQVTAVVAAFLTFAAFLFRGGVTPAPAAMCGALLGYLFYNVYPAKVMMGDTGSLAIGGFVVGVAYVTNLPLFIPFFGIIYAMEVLSDVLQVGYFKLTHGKRLFRMAPIHHHFEKGGWSETKVVYMFTLITIFGCIVSFAGFL
ncbi:MAG: phospho-N-acetylmuramoyl-pentapeptide-transferase [Lachnospiraceae bacterium]|nr:phospho-N-acetylmuramoyl-pentapeptide-transferase [Lachnospiraceae bacterium]